MSINSTGVVRATALPQITPTLNWWSFLVVAHLLLSPWTNSSTGILHVKLTWERCLEGLNANRLSSDTTWTLNATQQLSDLCYKSMETCYDKDHSRVLFGLWYFYCTRQSTRWLDIRWFTCCRCRWVGGIDRGHWEWWSRYDDQDIDNMGDSFSNTE